MARLLALLICLVALGAFAADASDLVFAGKPDAVTLKESQTVRSLSFAAPGFTLMPGDNVLTLDQGIAGDDYTVRFTGRNGGLRFSNGGTLNGTMVGPGLTKVWVDGGTLACGGKWEIAAGGQASTFIYPANGARVLFTGAAHINNQLPDMINARVLFVHGQGTGETVEFAPDFEADYMGFPNMDAWHLDGFSVLFMRDVTLVTHATHSLPSCHKRSGSGAHSHHGVITFQAGAANRWVVRGETQHYDGVVSGEQTMTIRTEADLVHTGIYTEDAHCYFGGNNAKPVAIAKEGPASLVLLGAQIYPQGTTMDIREGLVRFCSNAADPGLIGRNAYPKPEQTGAHLQLRVLSAGRATIDVPGPCGVASVNVEGSIDVQKGTLAIAGDCTSADTAQWTLHLPSPARLGGQSVPALTVGGTFAQGGTLAIPTAKPGTYTLFTAKAYAGAFTLKLPEGLTGTLVDGVLTVK